MPVRAISGATRSPLWVAAFLLVGIAALALWGGVRALFAGEPAMPSAPGSPPSSQPPVLAGAHLPFPAHRRETGAAAPAPRRAQRAPPPWRVCLELEDELAARACLERELPRPAAADEIAAWICRDTRFRDRHHLLALESLAQVPPLEALEWMDGFQARCDRYSESDLWKRCVLDLAAREAGWLSVFRSTLAPERLFDPERGEAGVQIAMVFAEGGDAEARAWLEAGARGEWGGTREQIDRAICVSLALQEPGRPWLEHVRTVLLSPAVPGEGPIGSTLVQALIDTRAWPEGDAREALEAARAALDDPRFEESAAATIALYFSPEPPPGCEPADWLVLWERAMQTARRIELVVPNKD